MHVPEPTAPRTIRVTSHDVTEGGTIPEWVTCRGDGASPSFAWAGVGEGTVALAVVVSDPDAPRGTFLHWLVTGLPPHDGAFSRGGAPDGAVELANSTGDVGWCPPCPPSGTHRYVFAVHALDAHVTGGSSQETLDAIARHTVAWGALTGLVTAR